MAVLYTMGRDSVTFCCACAPQGTRGVGVRGSFTAWQDGPQLVAQADGTWALTVPLKSVCTPGNCGLPEFVLYATRSDGSRQTLPPDERAGFSFLGNTVIVREDDADSRAYVAKAQEQARAIRPLKDFDLHDSADRHTLANMRRVPGTTQLWRGYHPYKQSRPGLDTEAARLCTVNELLERHGIASVLTLSGDEPCDATLGESLSPYLKAICRAGNHFVTDTSYETVYFRPDSAEYAALVASIVRFVNGHPAPYYIHCRLGSDRTGTMSAVLAALCGAAWNDIAADYEQTSRMGIGEYRDRRLLAHSFAVLLGSDPAAQDLTGTGLQRAVTARLVQSGAVTRRELLQAARCLTA